ncbi:MAG: hypothetical protein LC624_07085 [Halobacteriales archaeon]|nr:hypothetical protein [Halobacteriales archaeon]
MRRAALAVLAALLSGCAAPEPPLGDLPPACPTAPATHAFAFPDIEEASGLARSLREPCLLWVQDDSGNAPVLYATDAFGRHLGSVRLPVPNVDWEDMASFARDNTSYLLVGDIGNNALARGSVTLFVLPEPGLDAARARITLDARDVRGVSLRYPDQPFNAESVAVDAAADEVLIVSKGGALASSGGAGPDQSLYSVPLSAALRDGAATMRFRARIPGIHADAPGLFGAGSGGAVTAMDLRPDGRQLALLTYREVLRWDRAANQTWADALQASPSSLPVPAEGARQMEGIAYSADAAWLFVAAEQGRPNSMLSVLALR